MIDLRKYVQTIYAILEWLFKCEQCHFFCRSKTHDSWSASLQLRSRLLLLVSEVATMKTSVAKEIVVDHLTSVFRLSKHFGRANLNPFGENLRFETFIYTIHEIFLHFSTSFKVEWTTNIVPIYSLRWLSTLTFDRK